MSFTIEQLREEALRLAPEDRARLASELINSLDALDEVDQAPVDAANRLDEVRMAHRWPGPCTTATSRPDAFADPATQNETSPILPRALPYCMGMVYT